jgi:uncharacterized protein (TIGR02118 family)
MVTVMAMYPASASFDRTYYIQKHMPLVHKNLEPHGLKKTEVHGIAGTASGDPGPYHVVTLLYFDDMRTLLDALATPEAEAVVADLKNFFGGDAALLISEVTREA